MTAPCPTPAARERVTACVAGVPADLRVDVAASLLSGMDAGELRETLDRAKLGGKLAVLARRVAVKLAGEYDEANNAAQGLGGARVAGMWELARQAMWLADQLEGRADG